MSEKAHRRWMGHPLPDDVTSELTLVELTWTKGKVEHWIRFGRQSYEHILNDSDRIVGFSPGSIFCFVRWAANGYGTVVSRIDILSAVRRGAPYQTLPFVRPGGELLLKIHGWPKVEQVLQAVDAIEALAIDPVDASPDYWRHLHNRLTAGEEAHPYTRSEHHAWLKRRRVQ